MAKELSAQSMIALGDTMIELVYHDTWKMSDKIRWVTDHLS